MILAFIGTAGSGKTTLTAEFGKYLSENGYRVAYVNLDTGVKRLPYTPNLDVREKVTAWSLMDEGLGPNGGAIVKSYDILAEYTGGEYAEKIRELEKESDYVLIDTPPARWKLFSSTSSGSS